MLRSGLTPVAPARMSRRAASGPMTHEETHMRNEFLAFLKQYGVIGLTIAVIIGVKANALVTALVDGVLMPIVTFFIPGGGWRTATLDVGPIHFLLGPVFGAGLDFLIVALMVVWGSRQ